MTVHKFIKSAHFHFTLEDICFSQVQDISPLGRVQETQERKQPIDYFPFLHIGRLIRNPGHTNQMKMKFKEGRNNFTF